MHPWCSAACRNGRLRKRLPRAPAKSGSSRGKGDKPDASDRALLSTSGRHRTAAHGSSPWSRWDRWARITTDATSCAFPWMPRSDVNRCCAAARSRQTIFRSIAPVRRLPHFCRGPPPARWTCRPRRRASFTRCSAGAGRHWPLTTPAWHGSSTARTRDSAWCISPQDAHGRCH